MVDLATLSFLRTITQLKNNSSEEISAWDQDNVNIEQENSESSESFFATGVGSSTKDFEIPILELETFDNLDTYYFVSSGVFYTAFAKNSLSLKLAAYCFNVELGVGQIQRIFYITLNLLVKYGLIKRYDQYVHKGGSSKTIVNFGIPWEQLHVNLLGGYTPAPSITLCIAEDLVRYGWSAASLTPLMIKNYAGLKESKINPSAVFIMDSVLHQIDYGSLALSEKLYSTLLVTELFNTKQALANSKKETKQTHEAYKKVSNQFKVTTQLLGINDHILNILEKLDGILAKNKVRKKITTKFTPTEYKELLTFWAEALGRGVANAEHYNTILTLLKDPQVEAQIVESREPSLGGELKYSKPKLINFPGSEGLKSLYVTKMELKCKLFELQNNYLQILARKRALQQFEGLLDLLKNQNFNNFYLQHFLDFRGRVYSRSVLSTINTKWLRSIYYYGDWTEMELDQLDKQLIQTKTYAIISCYFNFIETLNPASNRPVVLQAIIWCLVDLAKPFKTRLAVDSKVSLQTFLEKGVEIYKKAKDILYIDESIEFEENLEINKTIMILKELIAGNVSKKYFLHKDSTASVLQHLFKVVGVRDRGALEACNIAGIDVWTDPYTVILEDFLKNTTISTASLPFFNRSALKKVMMTYHYSATYHTAVKYFLQACKEKVVGNSALSKETEKTLNTDFLKFFNYLKNHHETNLFYEIESLKLTENLKDLVFQDQSQVSLLYCKTKAIRSEVKLASENLRTTFTSQKVENETFDKLKTRRAFRANTIHALDANYARKVLNYLPVLVVHDSFAPSIQQISLVIDKLNEIYKERVLVVEFFETKNAHLIDQAFSIFIIL